MSLEVLQKLKYNSKIIDVRSVRGNGSSILRVETDSLFFNTHFDRDCSEFLHLLRYAW